MTEKLPPPGRQQFYPGPATAFLFSFNFWIYTDPQNPPAVVEARIGDYGCRFYQPFRRDDLPFVPAPITLDRARIPTRPHRRGVPARTVLSPRTFAIPSLIESGSAASVNLIIVHPDGTHGTLGKVATNSYPMDSLRVDIIGGQNEGRELAAQANVDKLMELLRWRSAQYWISRSTESIMRCGPLHFGVNQQGDATYTSKVVGSSQVTAHTPPVSAKLIDRELWAESIDGVQAGEDVPVHESLLLEAYNYCSIPDIKQAVLAGAAAVDYAKEATFERLWCARNSKATWNDERRMDLLRNYNLPKHLDNAFSRHFGVSYRKLHTDEWDLIAELWEVRGNVAHGRPPTYGMSKTLLEGRRCRKLLAAADHCIKWFDTLV